MKRIDIIDKVTALDNEAVEFGFTWTDSNQILDQIISECHEIKNELQTNNKQLLQEEIGDLIQAALSLCLFNGFDLKETIETSHEKFKLRFEKLKKLAKDNGYITLQDQNRDVLIKLWNSAKLDV